MNSTGVRRNGFTLLELLVVIAVMGMLFAMILPSLSKARERAKDTQCLSRLRELYVSHTIYIHDNRVLPAMNNDEDDGSWQYNYLIFDGRDLDKNFGPLYKDGLTVAGIQQFYCPRQTDPFHSQATAANPEPGIPLRDTRAGYGRRYHMTGKSFSQFRGNPAILTDIFHLPDVIASGHKAGVNVAYLDGHAQWVQDTGFLTDNELTHPFRREDNEIIEDIWDELNKAGR